MRWTREELQELVKRGSSRDGRGGSPENEVGAGRCSSPWTSSTAPRRRLPSSSFVFFPPAGRVTLGVVGSRSECHRPCQGVLRTPTGSPQAASLSTSFSSHSHPFPWASLTHLGPARPVSPANSPSPRSQAGSPSGLLLAPRTHARLLAAPRRERAGGRLGRAHFRDAARGSVASPRPGGLRGFRARDSAGCEWAPGEALKEEVVDLGTPGPP